MIVVNGQTRPGAATLAALLGELGLGAGARGVAVAVDGEVVPRSEWEARPLADGARVEVVGAIQGG
ncbi:MAG: sulfur carrier protein ThiS [Actinobacteria bacterium]|nr:sulfur carrier protein ThiS [Actinomycetota bacterium]